MAQVRRARWFGSANAFTVNPALVTPEVGDVLLWIQCRASVVVPPGWTLQLSATGAINHAIVVASLEVTSLPVAAFATEAGSEGVLICLTGVNPANLVDFTFAEEYTTAGQPPIIDPAINPSTTQNNVLVFEIATQRGAGSIETSNELGSGFPIVASIIERTLFGIIGRTLAVREFAQDVAGPFDIQPYGYYLTGAPSNYPELIAAIGIRSASGYAPRRLSGGLLPGPNALVGPARSFATGATWSNLSARRATIQGKTVWATAPIIGDIAVTLTRTGQFLNANWTGGGTIPANNILGVVTNIPATDFSGFQTADFLHGLDAATTPTSHGLYYEDASGNWAALVGVNIVDAVAAGQGGGAQTLFFRPQDLAVADSGGTIDYTQITWIGMWNDVAVARPTRTLAVRQWQRITPLVLAGGTDAQPLTFSDLNTVAVGGVIPPTEVSNYQNRGGIASGSQAQYRNRYPVTIGDGEHRTVFRSSGFSVETPFEVYAYRASPGTGDILFDASATCDISFAGGLFVTAVRNTHGPAVGCSPDATISHVNSTWRGWQITWRDGVDCIGAGFTQCLIDGAGGHFRDCTVTASDSLTAAMTLSDGGQAIGCSFTRNAESYAIELTEAGAYDLSNVSFTGYTKPLNISASSGTVTITLALGQSEPAYDTAGATVVFDQAVVQSTASVQWTQTGSSVQVYNVTTDTEIYAEANVSGTSWSLSYTPPTSFNVGDTVRVRIRKAGYEPIQSTAVVGSTGWSVFGDQVVDSRYSSSTPANFSVDYVNEKIRATGSRAEFLAQELVTIIRQSEATLDGIKLPVFAEVSGLVTLSPGVQTALTIQLLDNWQVSWAANSVTQATLGGGNIVGGPGDDPVEDVVDGPQVTIALSAAATQVSVGSGVLPSDITAIASAVWDTVLANHLTAGTTGEALDDAAQGGGGGGGGGATAQQVWEYATRTLTSSLDPTASQIASQVRTELTTELGRIDVATSTRLASASYTAPANADITAIKAKTDALPADPASNTQVNTRLATAGYTAPDNATITAINTKVQTLNNTDVSALATQASVNAIGTPLQASSYTAPDNAGITAIKAKTDNLPANPATETTAQEAVDKATLAANLAASL